MYKDWYPLFDLHVIQTSNFPQTGTYTHQLDSKDERNKSLSTFFFWEKNSMPWEILNYLPNILDILVLMFGNGITRLFVTSDKKIKRLYFITFS